VYVGEDLVAKFKAEDEGIGKERGEGDEEAAEATAYVGDCGMRRCWCELGGSCL
jgi:hypothetical protein